jgi:hypothetical protein
MTHYYEILLPMVLVSAITMFGFTRGADRGLGVSLSAIAYLIFVPSSLLLFGPFFLGFGAATLTPVLLGGTLFYIGFTGLEPILPAMVSKAGPESAYGTSLGVYNSVQFLGSFAGGSVAGALAHLSPVYVMATLMAASVVGFLLMLVKPQA